LGRGIYSGGFNEGWLGGGMGLDSELRVVAMSNTPILLYAQEV
jgi:hypothetical protein